MVCAHLLGCVNIGLHGCTQHCVGCSHGLNAARPCLCSMPPCPALTHRCVILQVQARCMLFWGEPTGGLLDRENNKNEVERL